MMKQYIPLRIMLSMIFLLLFLSPGRGQGYLHREGQKIVDGQGNEIILRGIGLGGWMLQEGYMLRTSGAQHTIEARVKDLIGEQKKEEFYDAWLANHTRKIDIDSMAAWGYNSVRLPMHYKLFTPPIEEEPVTGQITWRNKGFEMTDQLLAWCKANNMYLILDLHAAPGGQGKNADISDYDPSKPSLWESGENQDKIVALWRKLAERYANEPMIGGYDLINEPNWGFQDISSDPNGCAESQNTLLWSLQKRITEAIREVDQNHLIIIEGNCWGNNYSGLPALWDNNMAISFHKYWNPNTQAAIQGMLNLRQSRNVPIWLGETGENSNTWFTNAISLVESNGIGWAWWPLKKLGINNPLEVKMPAGYQKVVDFWANPQSAPKPTAEEAYQALMQLAENLKLENNIYHKDVVDAKIRQPHTVETLPFKKHTLSATEPSTVFATDYDLGRHEYAYKDQEFTNTSGKAGGVRWNQGYAYRNDGVDIEHSQDTEKTNGYNVGWTVTGEWLQYTVHVEQEGLYTLKVRTASTATGGKLSLSIAGTKVTPLVALPATGGYQSWQTTEVKDVYLSSGTHPIRLHIDHGGFNLNYLEFVKQSAPASAQPGLLEGKVKHGERNVELVFNQPFTSFTSNNDFSVSVEGQEVAIEQASLKQDQQQVISLLLQEPVSYGNVVKVSYAGTEITTASGVALATFNDLAIEVITSQKVLEIGGTIRAQDYAVNSGFQFETTTDSGSGQNAGYTETGDYLDFLVYVTETGNYQVNFRVASQSAGGNIKLQLVKAGGTVEELSAVNFQATGGWQTWVTVAGNSRAFLEKGLHTLRIYAASPSFNFNWVRLTYHGPTGIEDYLFNPALVKVFPNPSQGKFQVSFPELVGKISRLIIKDAMGRIIYIKDVMRNVSEVNIDLAMAPGLYLIILEQQGKPFMQKIVVG